MEIIRHAQDHSIQFCKLLKPHAALLANCANAIEAETVAQFHEALLQIGFGDYLVIPLDDGDKSTLFNKLLQFALSFNFDDEFYEEAKEPIMIIGAWSVIEPFKSIVEQKLSKLVKHSQLAEFRYHVEELLNSNRRSDYDEDKDDADEHENQKQYSQLGSHYRKYELSESAGIGLISYYLAFPQTKLFRQNLEAVFPSVLTASTNPLFTERVLDLFLHILTSKNNESHVLTTQSVIQNFFIIDWLILAHHDYHSTAIHDKYVSLGMLVNKQLLGKDWNEFNHKYKGFMAFMQSQSWFIVKPAQAFAKFCNVTIQYSN